MASLQTLRNKGSVIVTIVIALALFAFLLTDLLTSGNTVFSSSNVGEIDGESISIQEYSEKVDYLTEITLLLSGGQNDNDEQTSQIQNQAWESFVRTIAFNPQTQKLGLATSDETIAELFYGEYTSPVILQMFSNPNDGTFNTEDLRNFAARTSQEPQIALIWKYLQDQVANTSVTEALNSLVQHAAYTSNPEAQIIALIEQHNVNINYISKKYSEIPDSTIKITDTEITQYYTQNKQHYQATPSRRINYVLFESLPSEQDYTSADKEFDDIVTNFKISSNPLQYARANTQGSIDTRYYSKDELSLEMSNFAFNNKNKNSLLGPRKNGTEYSVSRIVDKKIVPDSLELSQIVLSITDNTLADSLTNELNKGASFNLLAANHSIDTENNNNNGNIGTIDPQLLPEQFSSNLIDAKRGEIITVKLPQSIHIFKVNKVIGRKTKVQLATINHSVEPSNTTINITYNRASNFASLAGNSVNSFKTVVSDSALITRNEILYPNQNQIQSLPNSKDVINWAYNQADDNNVSEVMTLGNNFIVACLDEVVTDKFQSVNKVRTQIINSLREDKKYELLKEQFKANNSSNLTEIASKLDLKIESAEDIVFSSFMVGNAGFEPALIGVAVALQKDEVSKPVKGIQGVFVAYVTDSSINEVDQLVEKQRVTEQLKQSALARAYQAFTEKLDIEDQRYKFY